ncbi:hypothetical protein [Methanopyrus sp.]
MRILALILLLLLPLSPALAEPTPSAGYSGPSEQPTQGEVEVKEKEVKTEKQMIETSNVPPSEAVRPSTPEREKEVVTAASATDNSEASEATEPKKVGEKRGNRIVNLREPNPVEKKNNANVTMLMGVLAASMLGAYSITRRRKKETPVKVPAA